MPLPTKQKLVYISLFLSVLLLPGCGRSDEVAWKKLITEGDAFVETGNKLSLEGKQKFNEYMSQEKIAIFPSNRDQIKGVAQESAELFGKSAAAFRDAANKYESVVKLNSSDMKDAAKEFISLKAQNFRKLAEAKDIAREMALLPLDESIKDSSSLRSRLKELIDRGNVVIKEGNDLDERANKVMKDNP